MVLDRTQTGVLFGSVSGQTLNAVNGKVLKIIIQSPREYSDVSIKIHTNDMEEILQIKGLNQGLNIFYPINEIDVEYSDYYYNLGPLHITISELGEEDKITNVFVYYDTLE